ncbi:MAG TPA: undecaprenyl-diphosphatase [Eubacterium sp.]|nr:undecaprenyl-diphosphatase [Eubacterium sp.]
MEWIEYLKVIILGIVEGITEWLPISSTGHLILVDEFMKLNMSDAFKEMFDVLVQLGAILAVVVIYFKKLLPVDMVKKEDNSKKPAWNKDKLILWCKILVACLPAAIIGLPFNDKIDEFFYNAPTVAIMLIVYGIAFIIVEKLHKGKEFKINDISSITFKTAALIGIFQVLALIPGTSRSGATIVGAMIIGVGRTAAAEFTFYLAIPVMFGASLLKLIKFGFAFTTAEAAALILGMIAAFVVSIIAIRFLMGYIKKHDFTVFGWYRIVLGILVLVMMFLR